MNVHIRTARDDEAETLSAIALRSKAHWGYSRELLEKWRPGLAITPDYIRRHAVRSVLLDGSLVGFYALKMEEEVHLDHLWLVPEVIGQGMGRIAFEHAVRLARQLGMKSFLIISDVHAEGFYGKMKALKVGEFYSPHQNRMLPKMIFHVPSEPGSDH